MILQKKKKKRKITVKKFREILLRSVKNVKSESKVFPKQIFKRTIKINYYFFFFFFLYNFVFTIKTRNFRDKFSLNFTTLRFLQQRKKFLKLNRKKETTFCGSIKCNKRRLRVLFSSGTVPSFIGEEQLSFPTFHWPFLILIASTVGNSCKIDVGFRVNFFFIEYHKRD